MGDGGLAERRRGGEAFRVGLVQFSSSPAAVWSFFFPRSWEIHFKILLISVLHATTNDLYIGTSTWIYDFTPPYMIVTFYFVDHVLLPLLEMRLNLAVIRCRACIYIYTYRYVAIHST